VFVVAAAVLALAAHWSHPLSVSSLALCMFAYLIAARVRFPVGSAWTAPTQLVFVPMLFVLPMPLVPLVVAGCSLLDLWPGLAGRSLSVTRAVTRLADGVYSLGPAVLLVLAGRQMFSWDLGAWLVLAFAAQVLVDGATGLARTWFAERIKPVEQLQMVWLYLTEACLSCVGIAVAAAAVSHSALILLALPMVGLLSLFARERTQRLDGALELSSAYRGAAYLLGDVIDAVDHYTGVHTREVVELSLEVARALGLDATGQRDVEFAALLHDVGKIRIPAEIINKPAKLDDAEWELIHRHTIDGESMLTQVGGTLAGVGRLVRASHERYDGDGYPDGLAGETIPLESRIVSACDAFNAITTNRPYRQARSTEVALAELRRCAGTQFDPRIVAAVEGVVMRSGPTIVRLAPMV
jgi:HD-GYP domain-containing protein (c-di-GMP phosphodiesterase class II)